MTKNDNLLKPNQADVIIAYAESGMNKQEASRKSHYSVGAINYHFRKIKDETGLNPNNAFDLYQLVSMAYAVHNESAEERKINPMTLDQYQEAAKRTTAEKFNNLIYGALGVAGEAGEVVELIKKHEYQGHPLEREKLIEELGDVLWYIAHTARVAGISLSEVAQANLDKHWKRYPNGYSDEDSIKRVDHKKGRRSDGNASHDTG